MTALSVRLRWSPARGADCYRLMVFDRTSAETIVDETVARTEHTVTIPGERANHDFSMRVRAHRGDRWDDWTESQPLPLEVILGERREALPPLSRQDDPGLLLVFTIDTECPVIRQPNPDPDRVVDELIFGDFGNGASPAGIGLHMDLLEHFGFRGSFFVDVLMELEHGQAALERTVETIVERGHEVELHVHAEHVLWSGEPRLESLVRALSGGAAMRDQGVFRRLMELSVDLFERRVGRRPIAYRAGGYRIADIHFPVLEEFGIRIDSSVQPYFNSRVSDWMRTRTQPFRVGGVLEAPPTYLVLNEKPGEWETRGFTPNPYLGDPVSAMPLEPGAPPHVLTFLSHSFELLRRYDSQNPAEVEAFAQKLRSTLPADLAGRLLRESPGAVRTFGEEVDDSLVSGVAGILRRVADRPDARCATYADLTAVADRFWPDERHAPVAPVPLIDRNHGVAGMSGARVFSSGLLSHLARQSRVSAPATGPAERAWIAGCENGDAAQLRERLSALVAKLERGERLRVLLRTLGVAPPQERRELPPLADVLFPAATIREVAELEADAWRGLPWDAPTFEAWLSESGFAIFGRRRLPRASADLAAVEPFAEKLRWLDRFELETEALEVELQRGRPEDVFVPPSASPLQAVADDPVLSVSLSARVDPASLPAAAAALYGSMHPGQELYLTVAEEPYPASRTTCLLALLRAGMEIVTRDRSGYRLLRPIDLPDIRRFAGQDT